MDSLGEFNSQLDFEWTSRELLDTVLAIASESIFDVNVCIFVDALDEHDGNHRDLVSIIDALDQSKNNNFFCLRLCLASRQENIFKDAFGHCPNFQIHESTRGDIQKYTEGRIRYAVSGNLSGESHLALSCLIEEVIEKAEGVFLWVRLVCDELIDGLCERA